LTPNRAFAGGDEAAWPDQGTSGWQAPQAATLAPDTHEAPVQRLEPHGWSGIFIPEGVTEVWVRAHDLVDGYGGREVIVDLTVDSGPNFEVERR